MGHRARKKKVKIGIISDSHDDIPATQQAIRIMKEHGCGFLIHAGDLCSPFIARIIRESGLQHAAVFGNNDGDRIALSRIIDITAAPRRIEVDGRIVAIFHEPLMNDCIDPSRVNVLIYGHTHIQETARRQNMVIVNQGALPGILVDRKTCAFYDTKTGEVESVEI